MSRPLSILHTESSTGWGGQEIRILTEAKGFLDRGHRVLLLTPPEARIFSAAQKMGVPVEPLGIARKNLAGFLALRAWMKRQGAGFDILNTHSSTDSWLAAVVARVARNCPPIVRTRHVSTAINNHWPTRWLYTRATAHIVVTGEALRERLHRENRYPLSHLTSIRTGIDLRRFVPLGQSEMRKRLGQPSAPTLGILATLRSWKGHAYLLEAFAHLRPAHPEWRLLVIGDGPQRLNLEAKARELGVTEAVNFVGNQENVPEWLACLDLFCLPSYGEEGVPQGIMQAMACRLAVVSTPIGAIAEAVQDGKTGVLVAPRDSGALAAALGRLMSDRELRERMAAAGLAYAREHFGLEVMLDRMEEVFRRFARRP